jgi:dTMP kinase
MSGKFIVFEGVDNSGKTTILDLTERWLRSLGKNVIATKHPGSTPIGRELRHIIKHSEVKVDPNTEALVFAADNSAFINQVLRPNLEAGTWVLGDRNNFISSMAYQISSGVPFDDLDKIHAAIANPPKIDLLFILKCDWETSQERKRVKMLTSTEPSRDRFEDRGRGYFDKLVSCYNQLIEQHPDKLLKFVKATETLPIQTPRCVYIDASQPISAVFKLVSETMAHTLGLTAQAQQNR